MNFSIPMDERTRTQFVIEFRKCLDHYFKFFEMATKSKQGSNTGDSILP
jgi:hypothetical protein